MADSGNCRITVHDDVRHRSSNPDKGIITSFTSLVYVSQPTLEMAFPAQKKHYSDTPVPASRCNRGNHADGPLTTGISL